MDHIHALEPGQEAENHLCFDVVPEEQEGQEGDPSDGHDGEKEFILLHEMSRFLYECDFVLIEDNVIFDCGGPPSDHPSCLSSACRSLALFLNGHLLGFFTQVGKLACFEPAEKN